MEMKKRKIAAWREDAVKPTFLRSKNFVIKFLLDHCSGNFLKYSMKP